MSSSNSYTQNIYTFLDHQFTTHINCIASCNILPREVIEVAASLFPIIGLYLVFEGITVSNANINITPGVIIIVKSKEGLWAFIHGKSRFSGLQSPLGITNGNRNHNKPLELI